MERRKTCAAAGQDSPSAQYADALVLAVQRLNSFRIEQKGVTQADMTQGSWRISQVETLIGLPRRDIQRACYSGRGGAAILEPEDGSWGKRAYSCEDVAKLFVVKRLRDQGMSLPEVKEHFQRFEKGCHDYSMIDDQVSTMLADVDLLEAQIACGRALSIAVEDGLESEALCELVHSEVLKAIACASAESIGSGEVLDALVLLLQACSEAQAQDTAALRNRVSCCMEEGLEPSSADVQNSLRGFIDQILGNGCMGGPSVLEAMLYVLEQPTMKPLADVWIAPGAVDYLCEAIEWAHKAMKDQSR